VPIKIFKQFLKFGVVGVANTAISYIVYAALVYFGLHYILSNVLAFLAGMVNAFYWNNKLVFKESRENRNANISAIKMIVAYSFSGLILGSFLLYIFVDSFGISEYIAMIFVLFVTVPLNFILNKFWVFR
jgi:putative flippase GtrA